MYLLFTGHFYYFTQQSILKLFVLLNAHYLSNTGPELSHGHGCIELYFLRGTKSVNPPRRIKNYVR